MAKSVKRVFFLSMGASLCAWIALSPFNSCRAAPHGRTHENHPAWSKGQPQVRFPDHPRFSERRGNPGRGDPREFSPRERRPMEREYRQWRSLPPEEKEEMRDRMERWRKMSPREQQLYERRYRQWHQLPSQERKQLERQLKHWDRLTPEERDRIRHRFKD